jgi:hypothetical protein
MSEHTREETNMVRNDFLIILTLRWDEENKTSPTGLSGLDFCRRHYLKENTRGVEISRMRACNELEVSVQESFANEFPAFFQDDWQAEVTVDPHSLFPGEIEDADDEGKIMWSYNDAYAKHKQTPTHKGVVFPTENRLREIIRNNT